MKYPIIKNGHKYLYLIFTLSLILLIVGVSIYFQKTKISYQPRAANQCGCTEGGDCSLNGQYCENFLHCEGTDPIFSVYICSNRKWVFAYPQRGGYCPNNCGATPIIGPTSGGCFCSGGLFNVVFKANRTLQEGENISCTIRGQGRCSCGYPCDGAYKERSCGIGPGLSQCAVSGLDCGCKPFTYSCSGSGSANGTFENATNAGSETVNISLLQPPPQPPPQPTPTPTPRPKATNTPKPTPTPTPRPKATNTPTPTPTPTSPPAVPNTPTPTPTPTSPPAVPNTPTPTPTPTSPPAVPNTPTPTEIILVQAINTPTSTPTKEIVTSPVIPQSGKIPFSYIFIPIIVTLLSLIF